MGTKYKGPQEELNFEMIKCAVCGFKDATSDKTTWSCPECEKAQLKEMKVQKAKEIDVKIKLGQMPDRNKSFHKTLQATTNVEAGVKAAIASPKTSPELKKALTALMPKEVTKVTINAPEPVPKVKLGAIAIPENVKIVTQPATPETIALVANNDLLAAFHAMTGTKPAEPAQVKQEFKVGGFSCKIVTTNRK
jgi:hypothetical protein